MISVETAAAKARSMRFDSNAFDCDDFVARMKTFLKSTSNRPTQKSQQPAAAANGKGKRKAAVVGEGEDEDDEEADGNEEDEAEEEDEGDKDKQRNQGWLKMGRLASQFMYRVPTCDFM